MSKAPVKSLTHYELAAELQDCRWRWVDAMLNNKPGHRSIGFRLQALKDEQERRSRPAPWQKFWRW